MDKIQEIIESLGLDQDKAEELMATAKTNPMAAMGMLGSLGITPEKLQTLMQLVMQNPDLLKNMASQFGLKSDMIDKVKDQFNKNGNDDSN